MRYRLAALFALGCVLTAACGPRVAAPASEAAGVVPTVAVGDDGTRAESRPPDEGSDDGAGPQEAAVTAAERGEIARLAGEQERRRIPEVAEPGWSPFATVGGIELVHPAARVARVGFHQSNHDGARQLEVLPTAANPLTLQTRDRGTGLRTAADVVVDPDGEVRAPVTGRVLRAGTYVLYCEHTDDYAVIEPAAHPGWEVKVLHISGVQVRAGDRVEAGVTVLAPRPTPLPFRSQVDAHTAEPSWPHVHIEVVDPSIPDRPSPGGGC